MTFQYGDTVILYENSLKQTLITLKEEGKLQNAMGIFHHSEMLVPSGSKIYSNSGKYVHILAHTPALLTLTVPHKT